MNFFEKELQKIVGHVAAFSDAKYFGKVCYGKLNDTHRVRIEFITQGHADHYTAFKATIINKHDGPIDSVTLQFSDLLGKKAVSNPNFPHGIYPYVWSAGDEIEWYIYQPTMSDYKKITEGLKDYLDIFSEPSLEMNQHAHSIKGQSI